MSADVAGDATLVTDRHPPPTVGAASEAVAEDADLSGAVIPARGPNIPASRGAGAFHQRRVEECGEVDEVPLFGRALLRLRHTVGIAHGSGPPAGVFPG